MEELGSHRTDFVEILYLEFLLKYVQRVQVTLKLNKNIAQFI
jgi:hypothetical protein